MPSATGDRSRRGAGGPANTPEDLIATDDRVVARVRFQATPKAAFDGVEPNGQPVDVEHIHIWRVADGKLAEHWMVRDDLAAMRQMAAQSA